MNCSCLTSRAEADGEAVENRGMRAVATLLCAGVWQADPNNSGPSLDLGACLLTP